MIDPAEKPAADDELRQLLDRRADRVRARPQAEGDESLLWYAEFPLGDQRYALPLAQLRAAVPLRAVTPVPLSAPHVIGILRFQGQIISALSLSALLGGGGWHEDPAVLLVVDGGLGRLVALDCEQIPKPLGIPAHLIEAAMADGLRTLTPLQLPGLPRLELIDLQLLLASPPHEAPHAG